MFSCSLDNYDRYTLVGEPFVFKWQWLTGLDKVNNETLLSLLKLGFHSVFLQRGNYRRKKKPTKMPAKLKKKVIISTINRNNRNNRNNMNKLLWLATCPWQKGHN